MDNTTNNIYFPTTSKNSSITYFSKDGSRQKQQALPFPGLNAPPQNAPFTNSSSLSTQSNLPEYASANHLQQTPSKRLESLRKSPNNQNIILNKDPAPPPPLAVVDFSAEKRLAYSRLLDNCPSFERPPKRRRPGDLTNSPSIDLTDLSSIDLTDLSSIDLTDLSSIDLTNSPTIGISASTPREPSFSAEPTPAIPDHLLPFSFKKRETKLSAPPSHQIPNHDKADSHLDNPFAIPTPISPLIENHLLLLFDAPDQQVVQSLGVYNLIIESREIPLLKRILAKKISTKLVKTRQEEKFLDYMRQKTLFF